ncbi:hypothetical protein H8N03_08345 [Ramlibacter sp. USB13]|uniref:GNAT family acetyltransferase n=1 Tax=Ramlibacter cellulosilyticus TaxID=2764187 RepID=A0A923SB78_9BURK|nr:hypothetical protein [Ramlibacter cellulosilyticus]MBC5782953.1 hypothetical protein [Ramlibacter cellulosilyticus]
MRIVLGAFAVVQGVMAALFAIAAVVLMAAAARVGWDAVSAGLHMSAAQEVIDAVGLLAAAVVALQIAQTIAEEEVIREVHVSAPTRVRRFLSRFLVVLVVALVIEGLVATIKALHEDMTQLLHASLLIVSSAALLAGWGVFVRLNRSAEELEPEAMEQAKEEDEKLE